MSTSTHLSLGEIVKLEATEQGYIKLVFAVNIPFKTISITFNVFNKLLLRDLEKDFDIGDFVQADYHYKGTFTQLDHLTRMMRFDNCPICYTNLEPMDAQRFDCPGCALMSEDNHKERISEKMKLLECNPTQYKYSPGYKIKFMSEDQEYCLGAAVFKNSPLFDRLKDLRINHFYHVHGWKNKQGFKSTPPEIVNIHDIY